jgi:hypothetical protein
MPRLPEVGGGKTVAQDESESGGAELEEFLLAETQLFRQQIQMLAQYQGSFEQVSRSLMAIAERLENMPQPGPAGTSGTPTSAVQASIRAYRNTVQSLSRLPWDLEQDVEARRGEALEGTAAAVLDELVEIIEEEAGQGPPQGGVSRSTSPRPQTSTRISGNSRGRPRGPRPS